MPKRSRDVGKDGDVFKVLEYITALAVDLLQDGKSTRRIVSHGFTRIHCFTSCHLYFVILLQEASDRKEVEEDLEGALL